MAGIDWAVDHREKDTGRAAARRVVGSLDSGSGTDYWGSGEDIDSGNLRGQGTCGK